MVKIALDATYAAYPERTGTGVYSEKLISALTAILSPEERTQFQIILSFRPGPYWRWARKQEWPDVFTLSPLLDSWLQIPRARLFHGLNQRLPEKRYPLQVVTLHERFPPVAQNYSTPEFQRHMTARIESAIRRADRIIAVSQAVRQQLVQYDPALDSKIRVIHHGVDPARPVAPAEQDAFRERVLGFGKGEKFFLNVGAIQVRKNIANIVLALKELPDFRLVLVGGDGYGAEQIHALIRQEGMEERVRRLGHQQPETLRLLYSAATALVFPSLEEAFGLPILEAMSYGLPVITSRNSALPEVAGDAALYVDPQNASEIGEAMRRVTEDEALASDLSRRGKQRAALFSWEKCARQTWDVYREVLEEQGMS
ncbi:MAG: glycosyltransferase family 4 protein [Acidobacteria bacterium]|nr:glycosyltransferase family 4 protein [Acidobacteriota bacterium]